MEPNKPEEQKVDVNFESHPPIEQDLDGITALLKQNLLQYVDCNSLAQHLIGLKDVTHVIALEASEEESTDEDDEPDDDIYGVASVVDLTSKSGSHADVGTQLLKFLKNKCPDVKRIAESSSDGSYVKLGLIINERYINLPPQLALPTMKSLTKCIEDSNFTHLIFVSKVLLRSRDLDTKLPSKKAKSSQSSSKDAEPIIYVNPEEEIVFEASEHHADIDVSSQCDENATWSFSSDIKYIPHRRIIVLKRDKWQTLLRDLEKELNQD